MVMTSTWLRSERGSESSRSLTLKRALLIPKRRALRRASLMADGEMSSPHTSERFTSCATASAIGPAPVATSTAWRTPRRRRSALTASPASNSLDVRGTNTPSRTRRSSPRKGKRPTMRATGSPAMRRATMRANRRRCAGGSAERRTRGVMLSSITSLISSSAS